MSDKIAALVDVIESMTLVLQNQEPEVPNTMITVDGKKFRCMCGCNVFHKMKKDDDIYICNACESEFEAE